MLYTDERTMGDLNNKKGISFPKRSILGYVQAYLAFPHFLSYSPPCSISFLLTFTLSVDAIIHGFSKKIITVSTMDGIEENHIDNEGSFSNFTDPFSISRLL